MRRLGNLSICTFLILCISSSSSAQSPRLKIHDGQKLAAVGNSLGERMNLYGNFESRLHLRHAGSQIRFRNFCWPADEVGERQRPGSYTKIDDPVAVFAPEAYLCFFGTNESYAGTDQATVDAFVASYRDYLAEMNSTYSGGKAQFVLISPVAFE